MVQVHTLPYKPPVFLKFMKSAALVSGSARRRPDALLDGLVGLGGQGLAAVDAADLGLLTAFLSHGYLPS